MTSEDFNLLADTKKNIRRFFLMFGTFFYFFFSLRIVRSEIEAGTSIATRTKKSIEIENAKEIAAARKREEREGVRIRRDVEEEQEIARKGGGREIGRKKEVVEGRGGKMKRIIYPTNCRMER